YGKTRSTTEEYQRVLRDFGGYLEENYGKHHARATRRDCMGYISHLRKNGLSPSSISTYASYIHRFYSYLVKADEFPHANNPMSLVMEEMNEGIDKNPRRRELDVEDVSEFVRTVNHPRDRCIVTVLFKTGVRAGELANLRMDHVSLTSGMDGRYGLGGSALVNEGSILVPSDLEGNKRKRDTLIPVDHEVERVLERWLRVRPETNSDRIFVSLSNSDKGGLSPESISRIMRKYTSSYGWWSSDDGLRENVTPHYCRHFFTTHLRESSGDDALVKYLRGDVGGDILETYTHHWGDKVREKYVESIYQILE
ncbi:MAG: tyrosine-type recombinase/integrase, partial [Halobacteria archaeon]